LEIRVILFVQGKAMSHVAPR